MYALLQNYIKQLETDHLKRLKKLARKRQTGLVFQKFFESFSKVFGKFLESFWKVARWRRNRFIAKYFVEIIAYSFTSFTKKIRKKHCWNHRFIDNFDNQKRQKKLYWNNRFIDNIDNKKCYWCYRLIDKSVKVIQPVSNISTRATSFAIFNTSGRTCLSSSSILVLVCFSTCLKIVR